MVDGRLPVWLKLRESGVEVAVRLTPNAYKAGVLGSYGDRIKLGVTAPPAAGAANAALIRFLAKAVRVPPTSVVVVVGAQNRSKTVLIRCEDPRGVAERLVAALR